MLTRITIDQTGSSGAGELGALYPGSILSPTAGKSIRGLTCPKVRGITLSAFLPSKVQPGLRLLAYTPKRRHKMKIHYPTRQEFENCMEQGFDWKQRCAIVQDAIEQVLEEFPDRLLRNGEIVTEILRAYEIPGDRCSPLFKPTSSCITALGKTPDCKRFIRLGKELRCGLKRDGTPNYVRERLWSLTEGATPQKECFQTPHDAKIAKALALLEANGYVCVDKSAQDVDINVDTAKGVDTPNISRQPKPGYTKVTCASCGGTGHIYMNKE